MPREQDELDGVALVQVRAQRVPRGVAEVARRMQLVDRAEDRRLARRPAGGGGALLYARDVLPPDARALPETDVVLELIGAVAQVGDAQDRQLRVAAGKAAAGHQTAGGPQPAVEQAPVAPERHEEVRRTRARHAPRDLPEAPGEQPDVAPGARGDALPAHRCCGVVSGASSARAMSSAAARL